MKRTYRYFFYDFDGMLADTYPHIAATFVRAMRELRGVEIDEQEAFELFNITFVYVQRTAAERYRQQNERKRK